MRNMTKSIITGLARCAAIPAFVGHAQASVNKLSEESDLEGRSSEP